MRVRGAWEWGREGPGNEANWDPSTDGSLACWPTKGKCSGWKTNLTRTCCLQCSKWVVCWGLQAMGSVLGATTWVQIDHVHVPSCTSTHTSVTHNLFMENIASESAVQYFELHVTESTYIVYGCSWDSTFLNVQYTTETVHGLPDYIINKSTSIPLLHII